ncbi:MAG: hypothetical protein WDO13_18280 [Verrucomicrobiota bacterium]
MISGDEIQARLRPFFGYLELEMNADANEALEVLPIEIKAHPLVLSARLELLMVTKRWEDGVILGQSLCGLWPKHFDFWFRTAYCLHELKQTTEAKQTLLNAPEPIRDTALFSYNLACYEAQLGDLDRAKALLRVCFSKDANMKATALDDPDLEPLWSFE